MVERIQRPLAWPSITSVALPIEQGGWAFLLEPIVLGLAVAPSVGGAFISLAAVACFLTRHPLKLVVIDRRHNRRLRRTLWARRFAVLYATIAAVSFATALFTTKIAVLLPLLMVVPLVSLQLRFDSLGQSRSLMAELCASLSVGAVATAIALADNWPRSAAFGLWAVVAMRTVPTILYVRTRLRRMHGRSHSRIAVLAVHIASVVVVVGLVRLRIVPWLVSAALVFLLGRASLGLFLSRPQVAPRSLGFCEIGVGAVVLAIVIAGYALDV
jgi:hypothetical protein